MDPEMCPYQGLYCTIEGTLPSLPVEQENGVVVPFFKEGGPGTVSKLQGGHTP